MADLSDPPRRRNGRPKSFFYDPDIPGHIIHLDEDGYASSICVGFHGWAPNVRNDS